MTVIAPAVLAYSRKEFEDALALLSGIPSVSRVQIDVVDGQYAAPPTWPYTESEALRIMREQQHFLPHLDRIEYEVDLMCTEIERAIDDWTALGASRFTVHVDGLQRAGLSIESLRNQFSTSQDNNESSGVIAFGVALHLDSRADAVTEAAEQGDYVQCMGIAEIGMQGQPFDSRVVEQVRNLHRMYPRVLIQVDGGVSAAHAKELAAAGATTFVVGSAIMRAQNPAAAYAAFDAVLEADLSQNAINHI